MYILLIGDNMSKSSKSSKFVTGLATGAAWGTFFEGTEPIPWDLGESLVLGGTVPYTLNKFAKKVPVVRNYYSREPISGDEVLYQSAGFMLGQNISRIGNTISRYTPNLPI